MSLKETLRKMAVERNGPVTVIPLLNDPTKGVAISCKYRDQMLGQHGVPINTLLGTTPMHAVFVREGLAIGFFHRDQDVNLDRFVLHGIDLRPGEDANIEEVGSEVYSAWTSIPRDKLVSYEQLQKNWKGLFKKGVLVS